MMMSCVGFEVYKFSEPPLLAQQFFQSPPFGCLKIFGAPPIFIPPPLNDSCLYLCPILGAKTTWETRGVNNWRVCIKGHKSVFIEFCSIDQTLAHCYLTYFNHIFNKILKYDWLSAFRISGQCASCPSQVVRPRVIANLNRLFFPF